MTNAERLKLINDKLKLNQSRGIFPRDKHELSKAVGGSQQYIYKKYPITYVTCNDNEDIRNYFKKIEAILKIDLKTNEPIKQTKTKSFLKDYVFNMLDAHGNTTIGNEVYQKFGKDAILKELANHGYVCEILQRVDEVKAYKYRQYYYIVNLIHRI